MMAILLADLGHQQKIAGNGDQQRRQGRAQEARIDGLHQLAAGNGADEHHRHRASHRPDLQGATAVEIQSGGGRAEAALQFAGGQGLDGGQSRPEQRRQT
jgi:hypothetical protein